MQTLIVPNKVFKYSGIVYYQLSGYVDNNGVFVYPTAQERLLEAFKPASEKRFHFVEYCEPVTKVFANKLRELHDVAYRFVKDDGLPFGYLLQVVKNQTIPKREKHKKHRAIA